MSNKLNHNSKYVGLMEKSIGDIYPLTVSGLGGLWYVWNTLTGKASLTLYESSIEAHEFAARCAEGGHLENGATSTRTIVEIYEDAQEKGAGCVGRVRRSGGLGVVAPLSIVLEEYDAARTS